jgi:hypothetical protein
MSEGPPADIIVGVDTHKHTHAAVAITALGARVAELTIKVGLKGYRELELWARSLGPSKPSASRLQAPMELAWHASFKRTAMSSRRSDVPIAGYVTSTARLITSMPRAPPAPCLAAKPRLYPRPVPAGSR